MTDLTTDRLLLRNWRESDREPFAAMGADPAVMEHFPALMTREQSDAFVDIIAEGFSRRAVTPGRTTVEDLVWWYRDRINGLGLDTWFHTNVAIFRRGVERPLDGDAVIQPGDMLWVDFGITYLGLNTDTQQLAYVLQPGESDAPAGLRAGLAAANRVQDAVTSSYRTGLSGNAVLAAARERAIAAGLRPTIYSHPLGLHGHGAGPAIGFWDNQAPDPRGERPVQPKYSPSRRFVLPAPLRPCTTVRPGPSATSWDAYVRKSLKRKRWTPLKRSAGSA